MPSSREAIFSKLRQSTGRSRESATQAPDDTAGEAALKVADLAQPLRSKAAPRPDMGGDTVERFILKVQASGASVDRLRSLQEVPEAVQAFLTQHGQRPSIVVTDDDALRQIEWPDGLQVQCRPASESDQTSVTGAVVAVAESGSIVVKSGKAGANSLAILPDNHISVVFTHQLVAHIDGVFDSYTDDGQSQPMPRVLSFITGPSKTADVEQTLQHGAHGPKRKHIILVD